MTGRRLKHDRHRAPPQNPEPWTRYKIEAVARRLRERPPEAHRADRDLETVESLADFQALRHSGDAGPRRLPPLTYPDPVAMIRAIKRRARM